MLKDVEQSSISQDKENTHIIQTRSIPHIIVPLIELATRFNPIPFRLHHSNKQKTSYLSPNKTRSRVPMSHIPLNDDGPEEKGQIEQVP